MLINRYTENEIVEEITNVVTELGGVVKKGPMGTFSVVVEPKFKEQTNIIITAIINKYKSKNTKLLLANPLLRAKQIREDIYG